MRRFINLLLFLSAGISGCTTVPAPKYYRVLLDPTEATAPPFSTPVASLRVARFQAVPPLRQDSIVIYRDSSPRVDFSPYDRWESSPPDIVNRKLTEAFRESRLFSRVECQPSTTPADYILRGRILRFNQLKTQNGSYGEVALEIEFQNYKTHAIIWSAMVQYREKARADDIEAVIDAVGSSLRYCIGQIVQNVKMGTAFRQSLQ